MTTTTSAYAWTTAVLYTVGGVGIYLAWRTFRWVRTGGE